MSAFGFFIALVLWAGTFYLLGYAYGRNLGINSIQIRAAIILLVASMALVILIR